MNQSATFLTGPVHLVASFFQVFRNYRARSCESLPGFLTIADLADQDDILTEHVYEALQYRTQL